MGGLILNDVITGGTGHTAAGSGVAQISGVGTPAFGHVLIYEKDHPERAAHAWFGDTAPAPAFTGGGQDWTEVGLPFRTSVTVWRGRSLVTLTLPIVLQGIPGPDSDGAQQVYEAMVYLEKMWRPDDDLTAPPIVKLKPSTGSIVPFFNFDWVIQDLGWGEAVAMNDTMERWQQKFTLVLLQHRGDEKLQVFTPTTAQPSRKTRSYTVKHGDTLSSIARKLKVKGGWQALGNNQHPRITDPRRVKAGQVLNLAGLTLG